MSGIAGVISFDETPVAAGLIETMTAAMNYRGPDGIAHWQGQGAALGHCMLRTTVESLEERQPLASEEGKLVLVMDGRLDNWLELRSDLLSRGIPLRDRSDAELVLRAFQLWGRDCLSHIEGDFAIAIWNPLERSLFCARDPMGNKTLHYFWSGRTFIFATEMHVVMLHPRVPRLLNKGVLAEYLASEWHSRDETFWQGVQRLVAAHRMTVNSAGPRIDKYWSPDLFASFGYSRDEDYVEHYRHLLADTVRRLSRSNKSLAVEVSGGLDSSAIFASADKLQREGELAAPGLTGFTINFEGDPHADEIAYCRAVGAHLGTQIVESSPARYPLSWFTDRARKYLEFPGFPNSVMAGNLMQLAQHGGSRVLLNGIGGDEWLGAGRSFYAEELAAGRWGEAARLLRQDVAIGGLLKGLWWFCRFGLAPSLPESARSWWRHVRDNAVEGFDRSAWLAPELRAALLVQRDKRPAGRATELRWSGQRAELGVLADPYIALAHESHERFAATFGLELRRPYYTAAMVQFAFAVPKRLLFSAGTDRHLHRQAMQGLLPELVLRRQTKAEFSVTYNQYLPAMRDLLVRDVAPRRQRWIKQSRVDDLYEHLDKPRYTGWGEFMLWVLFGCDAFCPDD